MFLLLKWYLDVVTDEGAALIGYAARIRWGRFHIRYASAVYSAPGAPPHEAATIRGVESPRLRDEGLTWQNTVLGVRGRWSREAPPIRRTLARTAAGLIRWSCHLPRARATVHWGDLMLTGFGYAESLRLTIPPWKLPFRTLRWGRHLSDRHSIVWIDWASEDQRTWVWLDGRRQPDATLTAAGVTGLAGGRELRLSDSRDVRDRRVLATITDLLPGFARRLAGPLAGMHERKRLDRSSIMEAGRPLDYGRTLHEVVTW